MISHGDALLHDTFVMNKARINFGDDPPDQWINRTLEDQKLFNISQVSGRNCSNKNLSKAGKLVRFVHMVGLKESSVCMAYGFGRVRFCL